MAKKAEQLNLKSKIYSFKLRGEAKNVFDLLFKALKDNDIILAGGETTVKLQTANSKEQMVVGKGGRNQEAVLGAIVKMIHNKKYVMHNCVFLSIASDGRDNTEAAGAISDHLTLEKAKKLKLSPEKFLEEHNSFNFFKKTGDLIYADQNSFNVSDFMVLLKSKE
jgi:glycerate-2-kinase